MDKFSMFPICYIFIYPFAPLCIWGGSNPVRVLFPSAFTTSMVRMSQMSPPMPTSPPMGQTNQSMGQSRETQRSRRWRVGVEAIPNRIYM